MHVGVGYRYPTWQVTARRYEPNRTPIGSRQCINTNRTPTTHKPNQSSHKQQKANSLDTSTKVINSETQQTFKTMTSSHHEKKKVVVVGSGDKAHGLAHMYECNAHKESYDLVFTEPLQAKKVAPFNTFVSIESFPEALNNADICILAIPSECCNLLCETP